MTHTRIIGVALVLALVGLLAYVPASSPTRAQPNMPSPATESVALFAGCNNQVLTWQAGTSLTAAAEAVTPAGILESIWHYDAAQARFLGFSPNPLAPSDYATTRTSLDAAFICVRADGVLNRPVR